MCRICLPSFSLGAAFSESASYYPCEVRAGGLFVEKPYVPICLGFLYYSVLSFLISKLYGGNVLSLKEDAPEAILKKWQIRDNRKINNYEKCDFNNCAVRYGTILIIKWLLLKRKTRMTFEALRKFEAGILKKNHSGTSQPGMKA